MPSKVPNSICRRRPGHLGDPGVSTLPPRFAYMFICIIHPIKCAHVLVSLWWVCIQFFLSLLDVGFHWPSNLPSWGNHRHHQWVWDQWWNRDSTKTWNAVRFLHGFFTNELVMIYHLFLGTQKSCLHIFWGVQSVILLILNDEKVCRICSQLWFDIKAQD